jgi:hypothetical protein
VEVMDRLSVVNYWGDGDRSVNIVICMDPVITFHS